MQRTARLTIPGQVKAKKNQRQIRVNRRTGKRFTTSSKGHQEWHAPALECLLAWKRTTGVQDIQGPVTVGMSIWRGSKHSYDLTNMAESVMDALVDAGILADDNSEVVTDIRIQRGGYDKENPRVAVSLSWEE